MEAGDVVLDVGAGDGNVALAAARRGATVVATDLSPVQVERGRARCEAEGVFVEWQTADAEALPFRDAQFTRVLSAFGAVFAPDPEAVARELCRVCGPGGVVALTAWPPTGFMGEVTAVARNAAPPGVSFPDVELEWGVEEVARDRLSRHAADVTCEWRSLEWDPAVRAAAGASDCAAAYFREHLPAALELTVAAERESVVRRFTTADRRIRADYLLIVARVR